MLFAEGTRVFGDMLMQSSVDMETMVGKSFSEKIEAIRGAPFHTHQHCFAHGRQCSFWERVDLDCSGLPCQDNSKANAKRKFQEGRCAECYIVWAEKHKAMQTPLLILENTPESKLHLYPECAMFVCL